jgi:hypothetical protein
LIVTATRPILHVLNGDATRVILEDTDVPGDIAVWADVLYEGPCPAGLTQAEWRSVRARHHAPGGEDGEDGGGEGENVALLRDWNERLDRFDEYGEVVFWLEHDLFDQLLLIRHLHWLSSAVADRSRARLICIDRFPGRTRFLERLASGRSPLVAHDGRFSPHAPPTGAFTLTADGQAVLDGRADSIDLNGIDRWMGGVHLTDGRYRWTGAGFRNPSSLIADP